MMHMMFAALVAASKPFFGISELYCSTVLLHKANNMRDVRAAVLEEIDSRVDIVYDLPPGYAINRERNASIFALMDSIENEFARNDADFGGDDFGSFRRAARERLLDICPGAWDQTNPGSRIMFLSQLGDGTDAAPDPKRKAAEVIYDLVNDAWLGLRPPIPAVNRWNKIYFPVCWWLLGINGFYGVVANGFLRVKASTDRGFDHVLAAGVDAMGILGSEYYRVMKASFSFPATNDFGACAEIVRGQVTMLVEKNITNRNKTKINRCKHKCKIKSWQIKS